MSTSAIISVRTENGIFDIHLYQHWDGYPEHTLKWLQRFNSEFARRNDPNYKLAQLVRASVFLCEEFDLDCSRETGWGMYTNKDIPFYDYQYILNEDGTVDFIEK